MRVWKRVKGYSVSKGVEGSEKVCECEGVEVSERVRVLTNKSPECTVCERVKVFVCCLHKKEPTLLCLLRCEFECVVLLITNRRVG